MADKQHCDTPCPVVDDKLEKVWIAMGKKVPSIVFFTILGGLLLIAIYFGNSAGRRATERSAVTTANQEKTFDALGAIQMSMSEIKGELKHLNGRGEKR